MDKYIGKRLEGRYDILEQIGKGGMANVYRAYDSIDDRTVAVKILRDEYANNQDFLRRFKNESKAISVLNHPNIVKVFDVSFSGIHYIVMEYIDGVTLKEYIEHTGALPYKDAVHFTIQILHALQHAHDKGIVHRDIKPQNIMLLRNGEIKVTDFGIARFARSESRTISDRAIGSVHYISPEQAMGEYTDEKSDIYSTGILLYEMLTGRLPFEADTAVSVAIKQIQTPIKPPTLLNPNIPLGLEEITIRAVQKDSGSRYQSAAEMIAALEQFKANPNIRFGYSFPIKAQSSQTSPQQRKEQPPVEDNNAPKQKTKNPKKKKKKNPYLQSMFVVTLIVSLASLAFVGIMIMMNNPFVSTEEAQLPNFVGQSYEEIVEMYTEYIIVEKVREFSKEYTKGQIFEQSPKAGAKVKLGSTVNLSVSEGQEEVTIPDFATEPAARVLDSLRKLGLDPAEKQVNSDDISIGRVVGTEPAANSVVKSGEKIVVNVSSGPEDKHLTVPDVTGLELDAAVKMLEGSEFTVGEIIGVSHDLPEGTVVGQDPPGGNMHYTSQPINLQVSKGGLHRVSLSVPLPSRINRDVTIRARVGEGENPPISEEVIMNPSQSPSGIWSPSFSGEDGEVLRVRIYVDGRLYREYFIDFEAGTHQVSRDNSDSSTFQK